MEPRLLLITNKKSYTGCQLPPNSMTWMTLNAKIGVFMDFLAILGCKTHFKSELRRIHYR